MTRTGFATRIARAARRAQARAFVSTGMCDRRFRAQSGRVLVLMYHRVLADDAEVRGLEPGMFVRASTFARHLEWLRVRWPIVTLGEALGRPPAAPDPPVAVLTFDDGWRDNLDVAWPILERAGARATIFVVRDWIEAAASGGGDFLRPDEVRFLADAGIEFGAHTVSHPRLDRLDDSRVEQEMRQSRRAVEEWTGRPCPLFAYPYGAHRERTAELAGGVFRASVVVGGGWWTPGLDDRRVPRVAIHDDMSDERPLFEARVAGLL